MNKFTGSIYLVSDFRPVKKLNEVARSLTCGETLKLIATLPNHSQHREY